MILDAICCVRTQVYFESDDVVACIVTCGGLCPGLNTVIREIVCGLSHMYGVKKVVGIDVSPIGLAILSKFLTRYLLILSSSAVSGRLQRILREKHNRSGLENSE